MKPDETQQNACHSVPRRVKYTRAALVSSLIASMYVLTGCSKDKLLGIRNDSILNFGYNTGITPEAHAMRNFWTWSVVASLLIGGCLWFFIAFIMIRYRKKKDSPDFPPQVGYNSLLEGSYTAVPIIVVLVLFYFTVRVENKVTHLEANPPVVVDVTAFKWNWKFGYNKVELPGYSYSGMIDFEHPEDKHPYAGKDAVEIERTREQQLIQKQQHGNEVSLQQLKIDEVETFGTTAEVPVLVLPVNTRVEFRIASADVIHSFYIPEFLFKRDAFPFPYVNHTEFRFQVEKIVRPGYFVGRCAEMCGEYHSAMNFELRAVSVKDFEQYLNARRNGLTNAQALISIGTPGVAQATKPFNDLA